MEAAVAVGPFFSVLNAINTSKLTWGIASMVINLGSRFLIGSMTPVQQKIFSHAVFKRIVVFCIVFMSTRDVLLSIAISCAVILLIECLLHEESPYCIIPGCNVTASINVATGGAMRHLTTAATNGVTSATEQQPQQDATRTPASVPTDLPPGSLVPLTQ